MVRNLWGDISKIAVPRTPAAFLREQAAQLGDMTNGLVVAEVSSIAEDGRFYNRLDIVAPALDGYRIGILRAWHFIELYPVTVDYLLESGWGYAECGDENALVEAVSRILGSDKVKRVVASLMAQTQGQAVA